MPPYPVSKNNLFCLTFPFTLPILYLLACFPHYHHHLPPIIIFWYLICRLYVVVPGRNQILRILTTSPCSKSCSAELLSKARLIHTAYMHGYLISLCIARKSSALNRSSVLQHFEDSNAIEIPNRIMMFDFYPGLPHMDFLTCSLQYYHYIYFAYFPHQISLYVPHIVSTIACWHRLSYPTIHVPTLRFLTTYSIYYLTSILSTLYFLACPPCYSMLV